MSAAKRVPTEPASAACVSGCYRRTGEPHVDHFTHDEPQRASCAALFTAALAPWEGSMPLPFAEEALRQLSAELAILHCAFESPDGPPNNTILRRVITGLEERARVAAEVVVRLVSENGSPKPAGGAA